MINCFYITTSKKTEMTTKIIRTFSELHPSYFSIPKTTNSISSFTCFRCFLITDHTNLTDCLLSQGRPVVIASPTTGRIKRILVSTSYLYRLILFLYGLQGLNGLSRECASKICVDLCESVCPYSDIHPFNPHDP